MSFALYPRGIHCWISRRDSRLGRGGRSFCREGVADMKKEIGAKKGTTTLKEAIAALDAAAVRVSPLAALRDWRVRTAQTYIRPQLRVKR